ncbi:hypothetical protein RRG08_040642 [Elysia crispata]|uniref:Major facilitator superfamily (MFS) profile domain-containing protein n=1 Tax=Elysia crispata TaxID=231223 RepID=A0AAE1B3F5_9GAST|nr:hypothetical protein RRG08_040642 [Elysia crispata]
MNQNTALTQNQCCFPGETKLAVPKTMDQVMRSLGWMGCYQKVQFILLMIPVFDISFHALSFIFLGRIFDHKCAEIDISNSSFGGGQWMFKTSSDDMNSSLVVTYGKCSVTVTNQSDKLFSSKCVNGYEYSEPRDRSFVSEWDLVCEKGALPEVSQTFMAIGMMIGSGFMVTLADRYGRKPVYVFCHVMYFITAVATAFAPTYTSLLGFRLALGIFQQGTGITSAIMLVELLPTEKRAFPSQVGCMVWPSGLLLLGLICYLCQEMSWKNIELILSAFSCYSLLQLWLVEESLRWLDVHGKTQQTERLIKKAAKRNGVDATTVFRVYREDTEKLLSSPRVLTKFPVNGLENGEDIHQVASGEQNHEDRLHMDGIEHDKEKESTKQRNELSFSIFLKNKRILTRTAISCFMWFSDSMAYYGLLIISPSLTHDFYLGFALGVIVELPAGLALIFLINRIGRRRCLFLSHLIGGISLATAVLLSNIPAAAGLPGLQSIILTVSLLGKFGISLGFGTLFLYTPELFPTTIRSTGFGISSVAARIGGMIAPHSRTLQRHLPWLPGTIFAALALVIPVLVRWLPETHGQELPQTVSDMGVETRPAPPQRTPIVLGLSIKKREDTDLGTPT